MALGFMCLELDGVTQQDIAAFGTPCFIRTLFDPAVPAGSCRVFFQAQSPGVAPYASTTSTRAATSAGLAAASPDFLPVDFLENASMPGAPTITLNAAGEVAQLSPLAANQLAPGVAAAVRVLFSGGAYCDVQGTVATVGAALAAGGGDGPVVGPSNVAYVDVAGTAAGVVGDAARPFATIAQAVAALAAVAPPLAFAQVRVGPGAFVADVGAIPASLTRLSIVGAGPQATQVQTLTPGSDLFDLGVNVKRDAFAAGLMTCAAVGGRLVAYDGGARFLAGEAFQAGAMALAFVALAGDVSVKRLGTLATPDLFEMFSGSFNVETCAQWLNLGAIITSTINLTQDNDDPNKPPLVKLSASFLRTLCGNVNLEKQGRIEGEGNNIDGLLTTQTGLTVSVGGDQGGFSFDASTVRDVDFGSVPVKQIPDVAGGGAKIDLRRSLLRQNLLLRVAGAAANAVSVDLSGSEWEQLAPVIGAGVHADGRGVVSRDPTGALFFTPDATGDVIPPTFATAPVPVAGVAQVVPFPFRLANTKYAITIDADDASALPLATTAKSQNDCTIAFTLAAGNVRAVVTYAGTP